jgi:WD40 repeat protein
MPDTTPVSRVNFSASGVYAADIHSEKQLAVFSEVSGEIKVFDLKSNTQIYSWRHQGEGLNLVDNLKFSKDGNYVVTSDSEAFAIWS